MRLIEHKKGYLYGAANREGESYTDWRAPYIDRSGLLMNPIRVPESMPLFSSQPRQAVFQDSI